ncbi:hypothetical protein [uncultured Roseobacter sp.]|uniref:hypothetical protein n=1 Tax=uncultured Roseobacter sp. TaxID=114847 RepID=UPI00260D7157|nr:hypothetical protein [uncultured Roseobacter sp.]
MTKIKSPNYPSVGLADAIDRVAKIEAAYRSSAASREDAAKLLGYSSLSGPATKTLGALASYGLTERAGKGMLRVTPLARAILHPNSDVERADATKRAGLTPALFQEISEHFSDIPVPPEQGVITFLNRAGFHPTAVPKAANAFLNTVEMLERLEVSESHGVGVDEDAGSESPDQKFGGASVGDFIQWESQGALQLEKPLRVRWVSDDGTHLAVEGSDTGIPMNQAIVQDPPQATTPPPQSPPPVNASAPEIAKEGHRKAVFPVSEGDVTFVFPEGMTLDGIEELEAYLAVFLKKEKRQAQQ